MSVLSAIAIAKDPASKAAAEASVILPQLPPALRAFRQGKRDDLDQLPIPTRKTESWKYSSRHLKLAEHYPLPDCAAAPDFTADDYRLDCYTLMLCNGKLTHAASEPISGLTVKTFDQLNDDEVGLVLKGTLAESHQYPLVSLNNAYLEQGIFLEVEADVRLTKPVRIIAYSQGDGVSFPRIFVHLRQNAAATLIEEYRSQDSISHLTSSANDMLLASGAKLTYIRMNLEDKAVQHAGATAVKLYSDSRIDSHCIGFGGVMRRHDLNVRLLEPGAECSLNGIAMTRDAEHYDNHTEIEHIAPQCTSNETYRCIAADKSHIVFNGRIHIHPHAQKTSGSMSNKNLLLSSEAEIDTKPELEIYADDVKCAHGATVGQLDEEEIYYLATRGIGLEQARLMLTLSFVVEIVKAIPVEPLSLFLEQKLAQFMSID